MHVAQRGVLLNKLADLLHRDLKHIAVSLVLISYQFSSSKFTVAFEFQGIESIKVLNYVLQISFLISRDNDGNRKVDWNHVLDEILNYVAVR